MRLSIRPSATVLAALILVSSGSVAAARQPRPLLPADAAQADQEPTGAPVYFRGALIGRVMVANGSFTPEERAHGVETRLNHEILEVGVRSDQVTCASCDLLTR